MNPILIDLILEAHPHNTDLNQIRIHLLYENPRFYPRVCLLFSHHLNHDIPSPSPVVEIDEDDLLPGPKGQGALKDGYREGGA